MCVPFRGRSFSSLQLHVAEKYSSQNPEPATRSRSRAMLMMRYTPRNEHSYPCTLTRVLAHLRMHTHAPMLCLALPAWNPLVKYKNELCK